MHFTKYNTKLHNCQLWPTRNFILCMSEAQSKKVQSKQCTAAAKFNGRGFAWIELANGRSIFMGHVTSQCVPLELYPPTVSAAARPSAAALRPRVQHSSMPFDPFHVFRHTGFVSCKQKFPSTHYQQYTNIVRQLVASYSSVFCYCRLLTLYIVLSRYQCQRTFQVNALTSLVYLPLKVFTPPMEICLIFHIQTCLQSIMLFLISMLR